MKEVRMSKKWFLLMLAVLVARLSTPSLWACDPNEKIQKINSSAPTTVGDKFSSPNIYYGGWGFARSVEVSNYDGDCFPWISSNGQYLCSLPGK